MESFVKLLIEFVNHIDQSWLNLRAAALHERVQVATIFIFLLGGLGSLFLNFDGVKVLQKLLDSSVDCQPSLSREDSVGVALCTSEVGVDEEHVSFYQDIIVC